MGLSDVVGASGTTSFAQIGFIISFVVFVLIVLWALTRSTDVMLAAARSILHDDPVAVPVASERDNGHGQR